MVIGSTTTITAVREELGAGPLLYRYSGADLEEGAFVACTFWLVEALALTRQCDEATHPMHQAVELVNDVGLLAEEIDVLACPSWKLPPGAISSGPHQRRLHPSAVRRNGESRVPVKPPSSTMLTQRVRCGPAAESPSRTQTVLAVGRVSWGCLLLVVPPGLTRTLGLPSDRRAIAVMRVRRGSNISSRRWSSAAEAGVCGPAPWWM